MTRINLVRKDKERVVGKLFNPSTVAPFLAEAWADRVEDLLDLPPDRLEDYIIFELTFDDYLEFLQGLEDDEKSELVDLLKKDNTPNLLIPRWQDFLTKYLLSTDCTAINDAMSLTGFGISKNFTKKFILPNRTPGLLPSGPRPPPAPQSAAHLPTPDVSPARSYNHPQGTYQIIPGHYSQIDRTAQRLDGPPLVLNGQAIPLNVSRIEPKLSPETPEQGTPASRVSVVPPESADGSNESERYDATDESQADTVDEPHQTVTGVEPSRRSSDDDSAEDAMSDELSDHCSEDSNVHDATDENNKNFQGENVRRRLFSSLSKFAHPVTTVDDDRTSEAGLSEGHGRDISMDEEEHDSTDEAERPRPLSSLSESARPVSSRDNEDDLSDDFDPESATAEAGLLVPHESEDPRLFSSHPTLVLPISCETDEELPNQGNTDDDTSDDNSSDSSVVSDSSAQKTESDRASPNANDTRGLCEFSDEDISNSSVLSSDDSDSDSDSDFDDVQPAANTTLYHEPETSTFRGSSADHATVDIVSPSIVQSFHSGPEQSSTINPSPRSPVVGPLKIVDSIDASDTIYPPSVSTTEDGQTPKATRALSPLVVIEVASPEVLAQFEVMSMPTRRSSRSSTRPKYIEQGHFEDEDMDSETDPEEHSDHEDQEPHKDHNRSDQGSRTNSTSSLDVLSRTPTPVEWPTDSSDEEDAFELSSSSPGKATKQSTKKRKRTNTRSGHFEDPTPKKTKTRRVPAGTSAVVFPPITADRFGIVQERLWQDPFRLLVAVVFLNKTAGKSSMPIYRQVVERYPTPQDLADANPEELQTMIHTLGLQEQRTQRLIKLAKVWIDQTPQLGTRYRKLHYPKKGDGKQWRNGHVEGDADEIAGALEIAHLPACGNYAYDSWRIFCRDVLRGVASDYNGKDAVQGFEPEWKRVLAQDKELRAFLRWMWLREGYIWDDITGDKRPASEELMEKARRGETEWTVKDAKSDADDGAEPALDAQDVVDNMPIIGSLSAQGRSLKPDLPATVDDSQATVVTDAVDVQMQAFQDSVAIHHPPQPFWPSTMGPIDLVGNTQTRSQRVDGNGTQHDSRMTDDLDAIVPMPQTFPQRHHTTRLLAHNLNMPLFGLDGGGDLPRLQNSLPRAGLSHHWSTAFDPLADTIGHDLIPIRNVPRIEQADPEFDWDKHQVPIQFPGTPAGLSQEILVDPFPSGTASWPQMSRPLTPARPDLQFNLAGGHPPSSSEGVLFDHSQTQAPPPTYTPPPNEMPVPADNAPLPVQTIIERELLSRCLDTMVAGAKLPRTVVAELLSKTLASIRGAGASAASLQHQNVQHVSESSAAAAARPAPQPDLVFDVAALEMDFDFQSMVDFDALSGTGDSSPRTGSD
ncbi:Hypothetical protein D9617_10g073680 [Elsinoe fawcettii]|nr:Hypothetical protein D9617_10g073680 [Elsinoe fawcettii]